MIAPGLTLAFCGFAALSLSMDRHHQQVFERQPNRLWSALLIGAGWVLLLAAAVPAMQRNGASIGLALWAGELTIAAVAVALLLSYAPRRLIWAMCAAPVLLVV